MKIEKIRPIPKYIVELIKKKDRAYCPEQSGHTRYYSYLTKNDGELVKVTVAVRNRYNKWYCKQVAIHGIHSKDCLVKDMTFYYIGGYVTGWHDLGFSKYPNWYENDWSYCQDKYFDPYAPLINIDYALKFPKYKYSAVNLLGCTSKVLQYLRLYEKYPQMEYLVKLGLGHLAMSKTILNKISKDKNFGKWLLQNKKKLNTSIYYMDVIVRAYNTKRNIDELQMLKEKKLSFIHDSNYENLKELFKGKDLEQFFFYIQKKNISYSLYTDYITACEYLNLDLSLDKNRFPHDFKKWHDIRIDEYHTAKAIEDEKQRKELYKKFLTVANKYLPLQEIHKGNYICLIAKSPAELVKEGEVLDHCVGRMNYDQKFIREESLIFFVREVDKPDTPFVTMEYSLERHKILQCYAKGDTKPNDQTIQYLDKIWLPYANRTIKRIAA